MTEKIDFEMLKELIKMKRDNPEEYKQFLQEMMEVTNDMLEATFKFIEKYESKMGEKR